MIINGEIFVVDNCVGYQHFLTDQEIEEKLPALRTKKFFMSCGKAILSGARAILLYLKWRRPRKNEWMQVEKRFHFDFAGKFFEDSENEYFESYVRDNRLEEYITYHGIVGGEKMKNLFKAYYIFALPTRYPNEGQHISILESMGNGIFIITTNHADIPDMVINGGNGVVLEDMNVELFLGKMCKMSVEEVMKIERINRKMVSNINSHKMYISRMRKCFEDVLK